MADNLLKRFSNAAVLGNGNLFFRVETRSGTLDVECDKNDLVDIFTFLVQLAAASPQGMGKGGTEDTHFASFPLHKIGMQKGPAAGEVTVLIQTPGALNMGFRMPATELDRFSTTVAELAQVSKS